MNIEEMKRLKAERGYTNEIIAQRSGVPLSTVQKIFAGTTASPRYSTLQALEQVFDSLATYVYEAPAPYKVKKPGNYTVEDYYEIPDERRVELIDGVIYDMGAPTTAHQIIQMELASKLRSYIKAKGGRCIAMVSPVDVRLDRDNKTMIQPDVFVICDRDQFVDNRIDGAPDFVVEILSPSSKKKDAFIKAKKYLDAGVREYWLVDPLKQKVIVYIFENDGDTCPTIYGFQDQVPVAIFGGDCVVDFAELSEEIRYWCEPEDPAAKRL